MTSSSTSALVAIDTAWCVRNQWSADMLFADFLANRARSMLLGHRLCDRTVLSEVDHRHRLATRGERRERADLALRKASGQARHSLGVRDAERWATASQLALGG